MKSLPTIHVIDLSNWIHRAYHVAPQHLAAAGMPTGAVKLFIEMVSSLRSSIPSSEEHNTHIVFALDCPREESDRYKSVASWAAENALDESHLYKAGREINRSEDNPLTKQIRLAIHIIKVAGFCTLFNEEKEADDILATMAYRFGRGMCNVVLHTGDKDAAQLLVYKTTSIMQPKNRLLKGKQDCFDRYGVLPNQIVDWLTMMGDGSDNIPGVPGIGEKKAQEILREYKSLDKFMSNSSATQRFKSFRENNFPMPIDMMRSLVRLDRHVEGMPVEIRELRRKRMTEARTEKLLQLRRKYKFNNLFGV